MLNANFSPNQNLPTSVFRQTVLPADQHANGGRSSRRTTKVTKRHWPYLFSQPLLSGWNPSFLATSGTFCFWFEWVAAEMASLLLFAPFLLFQSFPLAGRYVCVPLFMVASLAILGLKSICQRMSSFLSDERSIHLWLGDGTQTPTEPYPQPPGGWYLMKCAPCFSCFQFYQKYPSLHFALRHGKQSFCLKESQASPKRRDVAINNNCLLAFFLTVCFLAYEEVVAVLCRWCIMSTLS